MAFSNEHDSSALGQTHSASPQVDEMRIDHMVPSFILKGGLITSVFLIGYFLLASAFDFKEIVELRYLNILILSAGIFLTEYFFHRHGRDRNTNYLNGVALGMGTGLLAGAIFSIFFYFFIKFFAPEFGLVLQDVIPFSYVTAELLGVVAFLETLLPSFMATFIALQYFKNVDEV